MTVWWRRDELLRERQSHYIDITVIANLLPTSVSDIRPPQRSCLPASGEDPIRSVTTQRGYCTTIPWLCRWMWRGSAGMSVGRSSGRSCRRSDLRNWGVLWISYPPLLFLRCLPHVGSTGTISSRGKAIVNALFYTNLRQNTEKHTVHVNTFVLDLGLVYISTVTASSCKRWKHALNWFLYECSGNRNMKWSSLRLKPGFGVHQSGNILCRSQMQYLRRTGNYCCYVDFAETNTLAKMILLCRTISQGKHGLNTPHTDTETCLGYLWCETGHVGHCWQPITFCHYLEPRISSLVIISDEWTSSQKFRLCITLNPHTYKNGFWMLNVKHQTPHLLKNSFTELEKSFHTEVT